MPLTSKVKQLRGGLKSLVVVPKEEGGFDVMEKGPVQTMFKATRASVEPLSGAGLEEPLPWWGDVNCKLWQAKVRWVNLSWSVCRGYQRLPVCVTCLRTSFR